MENNKDFLKKLGKKLKLARVANDMTLEKLMAVTGYHRTTISKVERGTKNTRILTIKAIADVLEVDIKEFF